MIVLLIVTLNSPGHKRSTLASALPDSVPNSVADFIADLQAVVVQTSLSVHAKIEAIETIRLRHASRYQQYYNNAFEELAIIGRKQVSSAHTSDGLSMRRWFHDNGHTVLSPKRSGVAAVSAIINDQQKIIMCTVPKIDSTTWRKVMLYLEHPEFYQQGARKAPDQHNIKKNGVKLMAHQSPDVANKYYSNNNYVKFFHCRNPVVRVLSAWMSKNAASANPIAFAADYATFSDFIYVCDESAVPFKLCI